MANTGFIVALEWRNKGLGWLLGATMLEYAKRLGYRSVIFNLVFSENLIARRLCGRIRTRPPCQRGSPAGFEVSYEASESF